MEDGFKVDDGNFVAALIAGVFGAVGRHIHLVPAVALHDTSKEMDGLFRGRSFSLGLLLRNDLVALIP